MIIRILMFILCGTIPFVGKACSESECEIEIDADKIENYCESVISGKTKYEELAKLLPWIKHYATDRCIVSSDRLRARDSLKKVLFNVRLERIEYTTLQNIILAISESI